MPRIVYREMVCTKCGTRVSATVAQAQNRGWRLWLGGGMCKTCVDREEPAQPKRAEPAAPIGEIPIPHCKRMVRCSSCTKVVREAVGGELFPTFHWVANEETKLAYREHKTPLPMCSGIEKPGTLVPASTTEEA